MSNTLINVGKVGYIEVSIISMDRSITPPEFTVHFNSTNKHSEKPFFKLQSALYSTINYGDTSK